MGRRWFRTAGMITALVAGVIVVAASIVIPMLFLLSSDEATLDRWSQVGQALSVVGVFFSGVAFVGIATALLMQQRELTSQHEELRLVQEEQRRNSEVSLRQLHMDVVRMAINDRDLLAVWPQTARGATRSKKDQYCNLILNLQKVAYEAGTIELAELRAALRYLMSSRDIYSFWRRAREARTSITAGDEAEDMFTAEVDSAFEDADPPAARWERGLGLIRHWRKRART